MSLLIQFNFEFLGNIVAEFRQWIQLVRVIRIVSGLVLGGLHNTNAEALFVHVVLVLVHFVFLEFSALNSLHAANITEGLSLACKHGAFPMPHLCILGVNRKIRLSHLAAHHSLRLEIVGISAFLFKGLRHVHGDGLLWKVKLIEVLILVVVLVISHIGNLLHLFLLGSLLRIV